MVGILHIIQDALDEGHLIPSHEISHLIIDAIIEEWQTQIIEYFLQTP